MATSEALEQRLQSMFDFPMTDGIRHEINDRVAAVVASDSLPAQTSPRRPLRRAALLAVAATMLIGAGTIASTLFGQLLFTPGWQTAWDRSVSIGLEQTVDGNVIRLERGYADSNQVVLGWSGTVPVELPGADRIWRLTDAAGHSYLPTVAAGTDEVPDGITIAAFDAVDALPGGAMEFKLSLADDVEFKFSLPVEGGSQIAIGGTTTASEFAITLDEFRAGRTSLLAYVTLDPLEGAPNGEAWTTVGHIEFEGESINAGGGRVAEDGRLIISTVQGVDDASGHWSLVIDELVGHDGQWPDNHQIRVSGPWVFEFDIP